MPRALILATALIALSPTATAAAQVPPSRLELRVLVVTDGNSEAESIRGSLLSTGVPVTTLDLRDPARERIDPDFLADTSGPAPVLHFQGVVLPDEYPAGLTPEEMAHLHDFEQDFGIRQIDATVPPSATVGLSDPGFAGAFDGHSAHLAPTAPADFAYLRGRVPFPDESPDRPDTWIEIAQPLPGFTPLLSATSPDGKVTGTAAGIIARDGREELVLTFGYNPDSHQFLALAPGLISWLTKGIHLGMSRSWFSVDIDDVFLPNVRWVPERNCRSGIDCPATHPGLPLIRMTPADVDFAVQWQQANDFRLTLAFNGYGTVAGNVPDPLAAALLHHRDSFTWVSHTWSHLYLGCVRDDTVVPWTCAKLPILEWTRFVPQGRIEDEITRNLEFARRSGIPLDPTELVTGEHGGLRALPQMPEDNPHLAAALTATGVRTIAADASSEAAQRVIDSARTVPRYPINLDYSSGTESEITDHYNWSSTARADGGSGECEATNSCLRPLDPATGFATYVVPTEARVALSHALAGDPRPHYLHQSQLAEDRTLYPVLERILTEYRDLYQPSRPLLVPTLTEAGDALARQTAWTKAVAQGRVQAWISGDAVTVTTDGPIDVPFTARAWVRVDDVDFGETYGIARSGWAASNGTVQFVLSEGKQG